MEQNGVKNEFFVAVLLKYIKLVKVIEGPLRVFGLGDHESEYKKMSRFVITETKSPNKPLKLKKLRLRIFGYSRKIAYCL